MTSKAHKTSVQTIDPPRNFTLGLGERVRALAGPPAYVRRKRRIEDLEETIIRALIDLRRWDELPEEPAKAALERAVALNLAQLNELIRRHNRYYPCEANLPMHPRTGALLERGVPWTPLAELTLETLLAKALARSTDGEP